jgi:predicted SPOUT superfamily RNA methylase MTH1
METAGTVARLTVAFSVAVIIIFTDSISSEFVTSSGLTTWQLTNPTT